MTDFDDEESECVPDEIAPLVVYEQDFGFQNIQTGFTSATIYVDLRPKTTLCFKQVLKEALWLKNNGYGIVFDLDFGFFGPDWKGFTHQGYFQACVFAITHFVSEVLHQFEKETHGSIFGRFSLHRMPILDKAQEIAFITWKSEHQIKTYDDESYLKALFFRKALVSYLELLAFNIPSSVRRILLFDAEGIDNPFLFYRLTQADCFEAFSLAISSTSFMHEHLTWQKGIVTQGYIGKKLPTFSEKHAPHTAIVLPEFGNICFEGKSLFEKTFQELLGQNRPFKVVPEVSITSEWHGIDEFILCHTLDNESTRRALAGFIATGGIVRQLTEMK